jgi:hypothetical protein
LKFSFFENLVKRGPVMSEPVRDTEMNLTEERSRAMRKDW